MCVKQISITLENVPGKFLAVSECLGKEGINIRAISVADTSDFSTVRFVPDNPGKTANVLKSNGYSVHETDVIGVDKTKEAIEALHKNWVHTFGREIYSL